jgi:sugar/nucleoside kinase (ribokinase family)
VRSTAIEVVHVGSASRDLATDDPRGWRLGGGVTYAALTTARLGLRTAAILGADPDAAMAGELNLLRAAGVDLMVVPLAESPVFRNLETPGGRVQECVAPGLPLPVVHVPDAWSRAAAWSVVPVAGEIDAAWASAVPAGALLVVGWQGLLRELAAGQVVRRRSPVPSELLRRADLVGVSRHDLAPGARPADLRRWLRPDAGLLITDGERGGQFARPDPDGTERTWRYDAIPPDANVDPTGAGDVFLAALAAANVRPSLPGDGGADIGRSLAFAAAAASLVIERPGPLGVADLAAVIGRGRRAHRDAPGTRVADHG